LCNDPTNKKNAVDWEFWSRKPHFPNLISHYIFFQVPFFKWFLLLIFV
jgi:hypothetical protein